MARNQKKKSIWKKKEIAGRSRQQGGKMFSISNASSHFFLFSINTLILFLQTTGNAKNLEHANGFLSC